MSAKAHPMNADLPSGPRDLAARRERLLLRSAQVREQLGSRARVLRPALRTVDRVRGGAQAVRDNRSWVLLGGAALVGAVLVRPRLMMGLGLRVWSGWQAFQRVRPIARTLWRQLL